MTKKIHRGSWVKLRDGAVMLIQYLPGDDWPGWYNPVPDSLIGGVMHEGSGGWYVSYQQAHIGRIIGVYDSVDDAYGRPKAIAVEIER